MALQLNRNLEFFNFVPDDVLLQVLARSTVVALPPGLVVYRDDDPICFMYVLYSGRIQLLKRLSDSVRPPHLGPR